MMQSGPQARVRRARPLAWAAVIAPALAGCSDDMADQPRTDTMEYSSFFPDGATRRPVVPGTVAIGELVKPPAPPAVTHELLALGRTRFDGICAACHGQDGYGQGIVVQRGFPPPPSLHEPRLREAADGHILRVVTSGQGKMPSYAAQLPWRERHAVVAYLRALQLSQHAPASVLSDELRTRLDAPSQADGAPKGAPR